MHRFGRVAASVLLAAPFVVALAAGAGADTGPRASSTLSTAAGRPASLTDAVPIQPNPAASAALLKDWLLVEDNVPWDFDSIADALNANGYTWDRTTSSAFPLVTLADYRGIIVASDQVSSFHDNMVLNAPLLNAYVLAGGTLVVNYAQEGWNSSPANPAPWVPGGVTFQTSYSDSLTIVDPVSPITTNVSNAELQNWGYSTHGWLGGVMEPIIVESGTALPTFGFYPFGAGRVYVTAQTVEWGYSRGYSRQLLENELRTINLVPPVPNPFTPQCRDGIDNDGNGATDYPNDAGCSSADDPVESSGAPSCSVVTGVPVCVELRQGGVVQSVPVAGVVTSVAATHTVIGTVDAYRFTLSGGGSVVVPCVVLTLNSTTVNPCQAAGGRFEHRTATLVDQRADQPTAGVGPPLATVKICQASLTVTAAGFGIEDFPALMVC